MVAPLGSPNARFQLESHDHAGNFVASLPYRNLQAESFMNDQGHALRCEIPYKGYKQVTPDNLYPGQHELWLYDAKYSGTLPVWAGPLWSATPSSSTGILSCSAQDPLSYFTKRILKDDVAYAGFQPADIIINLVGITNALWSTNVTTAKDSSNAQTVALNLSSAIRAKFTDLFKQVAAMGDGVDYYTRPGQFGSVLHVAGGQKIPASPQTRALEYGGNLANYSFQYNAQTISNDEDVVGQNGVIGNATNLTKTAAYDMLYQTVTTGSALADIASLDNQAQLQLNVDQDTAVIPSVTVKGQALTPIKDFDFGDQFLLVVNDEYVQYNGLIRVVGWQITPSQGDSVTTVIYPNDLSSV